MKVKSTYELEYKRLLVSVLDNGILKPNRTGIDTKFLFSKTLYHDTSEGFAFLTGKEMFFKNTVAEAMWLLNGETDLKRFHRMGVHIWDQWADENGDLGPVYGYQMRHFNGYYDQLVKLLIGLRNDPYSRRHMISMWNPIQIDEMKLPPCHFAFQLVYDGGRLHLQVFQRSADLFVGVPYDMALYNLILLLIADEVDMPPGKIAITMTDCHIYMNHIDGVKEYLGRCRYNLPYMIWDKDIPMTNHNLTSMTLVDYEHEPFIKVPIAK